MVCHLKSIRYSPGKLLVFDGFGGFFIISPYGDMLLARLCCHGDGGSYQVEIPMESFDASLVTPWWKVNERGYGIVPV